MKFKINKEKVFRSSNIALRVETETFNKLKELKDKNNMSIQTIVNQMIIHCFNEMEGDQK